MGSQLSLIGVRIHEILSVSDDQDHILDALGRAKSYADLILITGGIGPTKDDVTKATLAKFFNVELKMNEEILKALEGFFAKSGFPLLESNRQQAAIPENCTALKNTKGTAWGMWFEENGKVYVSMPGVPHEMKAIMTDEVIPRVKEKFQLPLIISKHILTAAIPESLLSEKLSEFEDQLPSNIKLAYLPDSGTVKLRLTTSGNDNAILEQGLKEQIRKLQVVAGKYIYGYDKDLFEAAVGKILAANHKTIATAESCTGGYISHLITSVAGSSKYFKGSVISYADETKQSVLNVKSETLNTYGAVSEQTVVEMVQGITTQMQTDYGIAVSGIAGPGGGSEDKPVGTVWIAVGARDNVKSRKYHFPGNRQQNIRWTAVVALEMMRRYLLDKIG